MKKMYVDFMNIKLSDDDRKNIIDYLRGGLEYCNVYSKIVVQFDEESELYGFLDDDVDTDSFVICHEFYEDENQYIMYSIDENAFDDAVKIFNEYNCSIYQFIIDEDSIFLNANEMYK